MIEMTTYVWFFAGLLAGGFHALMIWRSSHRLTAWTPLLGMLRLAIVAAVLVLSAFYGEIPAAAAGWALGLVAASFKVLLVGKPCN